MDTPWQILAYPHLSVYDKFRLGMLVLGIDVRGGVPSRDTYEDFTDFEDVPIREFLLEHTTGGVFENFFFPLLRAKFGDRWEEVSAAWLLGRVQFRGERDIFRGEILGYLDGGFGRLLDALVDSVGRENIHTNVPVCDVRVEHGSVVAIETATGDTGTDTSEEPATDGTGDVTRHDVDGVVVATMPDVLEALTGYTCDIEFQGTICSVLSMTEPLTDTYWLNIADDVPFGALIEHTNFVPPERYGGEHLLYVARYVEDLDSEVWEMDDGTIAELWLDGIESLFPSFDPEQVNWIRTARNPRTAPIYERGYLDMVVPYDLGDEVGEGIYYAGMASRAQYPERSLNGGIVAGFECADRLAGDSGERTHPGET